MPQTRFQITKLSAAGIEPGRSCVTWTRRITRANALLTTRRTSRANARLTGELSQATHDLGTDTRVTHDQAWFTGLIWIGPRIQETQTVLYPLPA